MPQPRAIAAVLIVPLVFAGCGNRAPSRSSVSELLTAGLRERGLPLRFEIAYLTSDRAGATPLQDRTNLERKEMLGVLQAANLVAPPTLHAEVTQGHQPLYMWEQLPTAAAKPELMVVERFSNRAPVALAVVARAQLIKVTGVTVPTEMPGTGPTCTALFTYQWRRTPLGNSLAPFLRGVPASDERTGKAVLVQYDDGWRLQDLTL